MIAAVLRRRRAAAAARAHAVYVDRLLSQAVDIAITRARRLLTARMPLLTLDERLTDRERVDVADVLAVAADHFGLTEVPADRARAILQARYGLRSGGMDLDTDAYDQT